MIDDYIKQLEEIISPQTYNITNFKDKISSYDRPEKGVSGNNKNNNKMGKDVLLDDYMRNLDQNVGTNNSNDDKLIMYKRILEEEANISKLEELNYNSNVNTINKKNNILSGNQSKNLDTTNISVNDPKAKDKIHNLNVKNMSLRHEIDVLKKKNEELTRIIETQEKQINKYEIQIENDNKYLLKLETHLVDNGKTKAKERFNLTLLGVPFNYAQTKSNSNTNPNNNNNTSVSESDNKKKTEQIQVDKSSMRELITELINENEKLKNFQSQVFDISKNYDEINENMILSLRNIQIGFDNFKSDISNINKNLNLERLDEIQGISLKNN